MISFELGSNALRRPGLQVEIKMKIKKVALLRKPIGILLCVLGLSLFAMATITVRAQSADRLNYLGFDEEIEAGVPGAQQAREAKRDIYANNYTAAIPMLEKGVRLGNSDAMNLLSLCYCFGYGVPVDLVRARQLKSVVVMGGARRALQVEKEEREERERSARESARRSSEKAASSSTYRSTPTKPQQFKGPLVLTPYGIKLRTPFNSTWDTAP
jgi:hypothetical protein